METISFLDRVHQIEIAMSTLYSYWGDKFCNNKNAALLFYRLHLEEKSHALLVMFCKRNIKSFGQNFKISATKIEYLKELKDKIEKAYEDIDTLKEAVLFSLKLETQMGEEYLKDIDISDLFIKDVLDAIIETAHSELILKFIKNNSLYGGSENICF